ncbi:MAG: magnesium/cobalt transporter CorA [Waterburya sp.]
MTVKPSGLSNRVKKLSKQFSFNYFHHQPGSLPGTIAIADQAKASEINLIDYNQEKLFQQTKITAVECATHLDSESVSWLDIAGLGDKLTLQSLGELFNLHPLVLEAIVNVPQRPKIEDHQNQLVIITQMANLKPKADGFWLEQVSFVLGKNYLLTVQEEPERDCFDPIRDRLNRNRGIIRQEKADYLTYCLWDAIIDGYFPILETYGEKIELLEDAVIQKSSDRTLAKIYRVRRELLALRRGIWSQRDALNSLIREGHPLISEHVMPYFKDCYDHTVQIIDTIETYRELASGLIDIYLSAVNNKMNEVMKLLTVVSSIFIPLTFIAGIYGMNFNPDASPWNMPELNWYWGYPFCLGVMAAIALVLITYFWRRGWLK